MSKKTLASIKKCPIDFLYLWASDGFISQLGSKANIIRQKKYYQYQLLWKTMVENSGSRTPEEYREIYSQWTNEIAKEIQNIYGITPAEILNKLALGQEVAGKDWSAGVYGIGDAEAPSTVFKSNSNIFVDPTSGMIKDKNGKAIKKQTAIYGADGNITGYSAVKNGVQYQSYLQGEMFGAYTYSNSKEIRLANGGEYDSAKGTFWQNAENYIPMIESVVAWLTSLISELLTGDRTYLSTENTVPKQKEWVEEDNTGLWVAGGIAAAGVALLMMDKKDNNQ